MRQEIVSWVSSLSPALGAALVAVLFMLPLAADTVTGIVDGNIKPEWTERMFDRLAGPAGATILGVVVIYFMFKLLMELISNMKAESVKKDEMIATLIDKMGGK